MAKALFITGTGTDVGKTALSLAVLLWAADRGLRAAYCKPVQCGPEGDDAWIAARLPAAIPCLVTHRFKAAVSPHLAAEKEGKRIDLAGLRRRLKESTRDQDLLVVEGAGGAAVPLNRRGTSLAEVAAAVSLPCLVAAAPGLGTLHHTLSTFAYLRNVKAKAIGFAFCRREPGLPALEKDNAATLSALLRLPCFGTVPYSSALRAGKPLARAEARALSAPLAAALDAWWKRGRE